MATKNDESEKQVEAKKLAAAQAAVSRVFKLIGVTRVVIVDDELNAEPLLADFIARYRKYSAENPGRLKSVPQLNDVKGDDFDSDIRPQLEDIWNEAGEEMRESMLIKLDWIAPKRTFSALAELLSNYEVISLSLKNWQERKGELTEETNREKSLFLFDLDMSAETNGRTDEGMRIIKELLEQDARYYCGLFSHLVQKDAEYVDWQQFVAEHNLQAHQHRFVVISKKHLPASPLGFAQRLKRAAISSPCEELRREVAKVFDQAFADAKKKIEELNVFDFEEIVFQSSYAEGVWEPDTVFRILALYTQNSARNLLKANVLVEKIASRIRDVVGIEYRPSDAPAPSSREIMRLENFEGQDFLRQHHIPLDLGDIFRVEGDLTEFILLAQPCDIMCRNDDDESRPRTVLVAPLVKRAASEKTPRFWKLEAYSRDDKTTIYADFNNVRSVPILALDLTVFHDEGKSSFVFGDKCPENVISAWQLRFKKIADEIIKVLRRFEGSLGSETEETPGETRYLLGNALTESTSGFVEGTVSLSKRSISFNIERIARLKPPRAPSLLRAYTAYLARDGFDHDLTRTIV